MTSCPCIQVNGQIAETACFIYHCIEINKEQLKCLRRIDYLEKEGIDTQDWDALKYATAISIMCMDEPLSETRQVNHLANTMQCGFATMCWNFVIGVATVFISGVFRGGAAEDKWW